MSSEQNSARYRQLIEEVFNQRNPAITDRLFAPDYHHHLAHFPTDEPGPDLAQEFLTAFPDLHVTIEDVVASDDAVAARGYWTGTFTHSLSGFPPTGKPVHVPYIDFWHVRDGKFVANWFQYDQRALLAQPAMATEWRRPHTGSPPTIWSMTRIPAAMPRWWKRSSADRSSGPIPTAWI